LRQLVLDFLQIVAKGCRAPAKRFRRRGYAISCSVLRERARRTTGIFLAGTHASRVL
jgi:hypothetical protein